MLFLLFKFTRELKCLTLIVSSQVPNTVEFADWIGRTKQKKISVIS
jgi:superfamily II RNA helicase